MRKLGIGQIHQEHRHHDQVCEVGNVPVGFEADVVQYLGGKTAISQWLFGQVMRAAKGRANPTIVRSTLTTALQSLEDSHLTGE